MAVVLVVLDDGNWFYIRGWMYPTVMWECVCMIKLNIAQSAVTMSHLGSDRLSWGRVDGRSVDCMLARTPCSAP